jgi:hypothetical protein
MTKLGFKQVMLGIDTYGLLRKQALKQKISINQLIRGMFEGGTPSVANPVFRKELGGSSPPLVAFY